MFIVVGCCRVVDCCLCDVGRWLLSVDVAWRCLVWFVVVVCCGVTSLFGVVCRWCCESLVAVKLSLLLLFAGVNYLFVPFWLVGVCYQFVCCLLLSAV